jgi:hypothetical protein
MTAVAEEAAAASRVRRNSMAGLTRRLKDSMEGRVQRERS